MTKTGKIGHIGIGAMAALTAGMAANMVVAGERRRVGMDPLLGADFGNADPDIEAGLAGTVTARLTKLEPEPQELPIRPKRKFRRNRRG